ncbi:MAG: glycosyltransferase [Fulvivirga sp.]
METYQVAILIPHYNNPKGLIMSVDSIEANVPTLIMVIDDGSDIYCKPNSEELHDRVTNKVNLTLKYIELEENIGIENVLNIGLQNLINNYSTTFIARLDCGDICHKNRLNLQLDFLARHSDISLVGTWAEVIDEHGNHLYNLKTPTSQDAINKKMNIAIAFVHPTIMFRTKALEAVGFYPQGFTTAEDYAFLFNFVNKLKTANLPKILLFKERSVESISTKKRRKQILTRFRVIYKYGQPGIYYFYGLVRTMLLLFVPYKLMEYLKERFLS